MSRPEITEVLEARLGEWASEQGLLVAYDNIRFDPPDGIYLTSHDMPATASTFDLAENCKIYSGVYQINIVIPAAQGRAEGKKIARCIEEIFASGTEMEGEDFICYILGEPSQYAGIPNATSFTIPVSVSYRVNKTA